MEFTIPVAGDLAVLKEIPADKTVGLGCVDCRGEHIDTPEEIVARVENALRHLSPERIILNPRLRICARQRHRNPHRRSIPEAQKRSESSRNSSRKVRIAKTRLCRTYKSNRLRGARLSCRSISLPFCFLSAVAFSSQSSLNTQNLLILPIA